MVVARNVAIVAALAAIVYLVPGGGQGANTIGSILSLLFAVGIAFFGGRSYRENRVAIYSLGDHYRALLYGAVVLVFVTLAASTRLMATGPGTIVWLALLGTAAIGLLVVFRHSREY